MTFYRWFSPWIRGYKAGCTTLLEQLSTLLVPLQGLVILLYLREEFYCFSWLGPWNGFQWSANVGC
jgi:hypothetical protein